MADTLEADPRSKTFPIYDTASKVPPSTLHEAAEQGSVSIVHRMVGKNVDLDINKSDRLGRTALHWAVDMGYPDVVEALLDYGANPTAPDGIGRTSIHIAAKHGHLDILKCMLKDMKPDALLAAVNSADNHGLTPLFLASQRGDDGVECLQHLMACGARYNS